MVGKNDGEIFQNSKKQLQNINLVTIKLKYLKLCDYDEHNKYSVSTQRTASLRYDMFYLTNIL